jgi:hypothetical protein
MSADRPGEPLGMLGARQPAIAIGSTGSGHVPACCRRLDGWPVLGGGGRAVTG